MQHSSLKCQRNRQAEGQSRSRYYHIRPILQQLAQMFLEVRLGRFMQLRRSLIEQRRACGI